MLRAIGDAFRGEQLGHGARDVRPSYGHRCRLRGIDLNLYAIAKTLLAAPVIDQHRTFVRRRGTLVGGRGGEHDDATGSQTVESGPERLGTAGRVEIVAGLGETRNRFGTDRRLASCRPTSRVISKTRSGMCRGSGGMRR